MKSKKELEQQIERYADKHLDMPYISLPSGFERQVSLDGYYDLKVLKMIVEYIEMDNEL